MITAQGSFRDQIETEIKANGSCIVKVNNGNSAQAFGKAKVLSLEGECAYVQCFGKKRVERMPISQLRMWKGGLHRRDEVNRKPTPPPVVVAEESTAMGWVLILPARRLFWKALNEFQGQGWTPSIDCAFIYKEERRAKTRVTCLNNTNADFLAGEKLEIHPIGIAKAIYKQWNAGYEPEVLSIEPPEAPKTAALIAKPITAKFEAAPAVIAKTPEPVITPASPHVAPELMPAKIPTVDAVVGRWVQARRERAQAEALLFEARKEEALAQAEIEIATRTRGSHVDCK